MEFNCLQATESLQGNSLLFTAKFPGIPGSHFIDLSRNRYKRPTKIWKENTVYDLRYEIKFENHVKDKNNFFIKQ